MHEEIAPVKILGNYFSNSSSNGVVEEITLVEEIAPEEIAHLISVDKSREVKIFKIHGVYTLKFGNLVSKPDWMPEKVYESLNRVHYEFEYKNVFSLEEAQKEAQYFIENL